MNCSWEQSSCVSLHKKWQLLHVCVAAMQSTCTALYKFTCRARLVQVDPGRPGALAVQVMVRLNASYDSCHFVTRRVHTLTQRGMLWHGAYVCLSVCPLRQLIDSVNQYIYNISPSAYHSNYIFCGDRLVDPRNHAIDRGLNLQISN